MYQTRVTRPLGINPSIKSDEGNASAQFFARFVLIPLSKRAGILRNGTPPQSFKKPPPDLTRWLTKQRSNDALQRDGRFDVVLAGVKYDRPSTLGGQKWVTVRLVCGGGGFQSQASLHLIDIERSCPPPMNLKTQKRGRALKQQCNNNFGVSAV
ncbi:hypothetical protein AVEN_264866-1 [Araneus ventricosus]|uniref:Uncharacterized protein n=1 Tax=Araneus ventricosus TaxID=182803 RepID=A0A4Y2NYV1_ARAVE|nr:hypothetical protein AVEN_264866-1 [Araneus ventricosus]